MDQSVSAVPCGSSTFIQDFLTKQHTSVERTLQACVALAETLGSEHSGTSNKTHPTLGLVLDEKVSAHNVATALNASYEDFAARGKP
eukprot:3578296-Amphidinium_carterae.2